MASFDRKIQLKGWSNKSYSQIRHKVVDADEARLNTGKPLRRNHKVCKKNKGLPHDFKIMKEYPLICLQKDVKELECSHCGKKKIDW